MVSEDANAWNPGLTSVIPSHLWPRVTLFDATHAEVSYAEAKERYERVLESHPDNVVALNNLAYLLADKLDRSKEAIPYAERAASSSELLDVFDTLGWVYLKAGRNRDAIAQFTRVREQDPTMKEVAEVRHTPRWVEPKTWRPGPPSRKRWTRCTPLSTPIPITA